ncbi:uncharacterized protein LOC126906852 [Daktulosphaira vitifoliae]|uniref:uncharacterized protein LOC126906852 n=1 Tax=Daktulosphaira vitifoliae TaxID=58002 RepID=UPI0021AA8523|nr:uncharacterized protein LOC126906852 [Daktulosphaira vitifoliae]
MLSISCILPFSILLALVAVYAAPPQKSTGESTAAAASASSTSSIASTNGADEIVYDQRQNGTENVRISLSDLKVVVAPADGLFQIMSLAGAQLLASDLSGAASEQGHTSIDCNGYKCNNRNRQAAKKNRFKLSSLLEPILNNRALQKSAKSDNNNVN